MTSAPTRAECRRSKTSCKASIGSWPVPSAVTVYSSISQDMVLSKKTRRATRQMVTTKPLFLATSSAAARLPTTSSGSALSSPCLRALGSPPLWTAATRARALTCPGFMRTAKAGLSKSRQPLRLAMSNFYRAAQTTRPPPTLSRTCELAAP